MNIVIFSGGTGSVALQTGFYQRYGDSLNVKIIVNAQDNGKSTGTVRKVLDGKINGPSDLRKNQVLRYKLFGGNEDLITLLDLRFTCESELAESFCLAEVEKCPLDKLASETIKSAIKKYFSYPKSKLVDYIDFSLANIIYAGLASDNFSLVEAGKIMARNVLNIPEDSVIVSDDNSLYLQAQTESGYIISDEGDIVDWDNAEDKIKYTFFTDRFGNRELGKLSNESRSVMLSADIIIFSSGTQWSSLIPTYQHIGFLDTLLESKAQKLLVVNNSQDKDMTGVSASDMLFVLSGYLQLKDITCIFNDNASTDMRIIDNPHFINFMNVNGWNFLSSDLSDPLIKKHDPLKLVDLMMNKYYEPQFNSSHFVFDYDDTLVGRNSTYKKESTDNLRILKILSCSEDLRFSICTGNSIKAINLGYIGDSKIDIYAEGGVNKYAVNKFGKIEEHTIAPEYKFGQEYVNKIINTIEQIGINISKIQNRNNTIISIKPIDLEYRKPIAMFLQSLFPGLTVAITGRTTIDISLGATKDVILKDFGNKITAIGDEPNGNDCALRINEQVEFLSVNNPKDTNVFLTTLLNRVNK